MNFSEFKRSKTKKIVFVWNEQDNVIEAAERILAAEGNATIYVVHAMPHESVHSAGTYSFSNAERTAQERKLRCRFLKAVGDSPRLKKANFEIIFGDRIIEIVRFAKVIKANLILKSRFEQSSFSKWIHGDLNERIADKAPCEVVFLEPTDSEKKWNSEISKNEAN